MLGLYQGQYGGRLYRRHLSERAHKTDATANTLLEAMAYCTEPLERAMAAE